MVLNILEIIQIAFGMAILSFVFKPNPIHRLVESLFIGAAAGFLLTTNFHTAYKLAIQPVSTNLSLLVPIILSILLYSRLSNEYSWISNYPIAFLTAVGIGVSVRTIAETDIITQICSTALPLFRTTNVFESFNNIIIVVSTITVISYFLYSQKSTKTLNISQSIGIAFMMVAFGGSLANSLLSRVSRTIGFLQGQILLPSAPYVVPIMIIILAISAYPEKIGLKREK